MKFIDSLPLIVILALLAVLAYFGFEVYSDYQNQSGQAAPGTGGQGAPAANFGSWVDDQLFSIGQSPQDLATAQQETFAHPIDTFKSILGIGTGN